MAFINVVRPEEASGRLQKIYRQIKSPEGQVDNVLQIHSLRPHTLSGHMAIYKAVLHHTGNVLPEWYLEAVGVLVSQLNHCVYCATHHAAGLKRLLEAESMDYDSYFAALQLSTPGEPFSLREQMGLAYTSKLTQTPGQIELTDINTLREAGFDDGEILELNQVAAYFAYANRTVSGLGVNMEGERVGQSPPTGDDESGWSHG
jgi:uncharacterized peroxidase-related enzyme